MRADEFKRAFLEAKHHERSRRWTWKLSAERVLSLNLTMRELA